MLGPQYTPIKRIGLKLSMCVQRHFEGPAAGKRGASMRSAATFGSRRLATLTAIVRRSAATLGCRLEALLQLASSL